MGNHLVKPGDKVNVQGLFGDFVIEPSNDKLIVMLVAGTGITAFMSMLRHAADICMPKASAATKIAGVSSQVAVSTAS